MNPPKNDAADFRSWLGWFGVGLLVLLGARTALSTQNALVATAASIPALAALALLPLVLQDERYKTVLRYSGPRASGDEAALKRNWEISAKYFANVHWQARTHLMLFGALSSAALWFLAQSAIEFVKGPFPLLAQGAASHDEAAVRGLLAVVCVAAVGTVFGISSGNLGLRIARRDLTPRFVAFQIRSLFYVVISALVWGGLLIHTETIDNWSKAIVAGALVGLLGEQVMVTAFESVALIFGVSLGGDQLDEFDLIQGLDDDERLRLKELGVQSMQGLAYCSTSALYMSSRYPYQGICDWQDQALLVLHMGQRRALVLQRHGLRRASEAKTWLGLMERTWLAALAEEFTAKALALSERLDADRPSVADKDWDTLATLLREIDVPEVGQGRELLQRQRRRFDAELTAASKGVSALRAGLGNAGAELIVLSSDADALFTASIERLAGGEESVDRRLTALGFRATDEVRLALEAMLADQQTKQMALLRDCYPELPSNEENAENSPGAAKHAEKVEPGTEPSRSPQLSEPSVQAADG